MNHKTIKVFTEKETELARLLEETGMKRTVALVLVYLANTSDATMREIERSTDLRQPEVSTAIQYMALKGWVRYETIPTTGKGRPLKNVSLAIPFQTILENIADEKKQNITNQLGLIKRIRKDVVGITG